MKTILVPTDFSNCSADAIKYAIRFAAKTERKLLFFHSTFLLIPTRSSNFAYLNAVKADKETKLKLLIKYIDKIYTSLNIKRDEATTKFQVKFGNSLVENITEIINEQFIDLIVMGTHGATGFRKVFMGSNATKVIEQSYCPVLAIPHKFKFSAIKTIAYAAADLNNVKKELKKVISIAVKLDASLEIFHIATAKESLLKYQKFNSKEFLQSITHHYKFYNLGLYVIDGSDKDLSTAINSFITHNRPSIVVTLTQKKGFFEKLFATSQTKELAYNLKVPLLAIK